MAAPPRLRRGVSDAVAAVKLITDAELRNIFAAHLSQAESQSALARRLGVSRMVVNHFLKRRIGLTPGIVKALGYRQITMYTRRTKEQR